MLNSKIIDLYTMLLNGSDNIVLGGSAALVLHGIALPEQPADVDFIIYTPTKEQKQMLKLLSLLCKPNYNSEYCRRSYKMEVEGKLVDFLIEDKEMPRDLLVHVYYGTFIRVNSIGNIFNAKRGYVTGGTVRRKDYTQSEFIKMQFNLM